MDTQLLSEQLDEILHPLDKITKYIECKSCPYTREKCLGDNCFKFRWNLELETRPTISPGKATELFIAGIVIFCSGDCVITLSPNYIGHCCNCEKHLKKEFKDYCIACITKYKNKLINHD